MIQRTLIKAVNDANKGFPVLLITGPRQVGKTTLLQLCDGRSRTYVTLDDPEIRALAQQDPGLFLQTYTPPLIIDEVQYAPQLFSHIKMIVDQNQENGRGNGLFWLTGSQKFHLMRGITETLAGRVGVLDLLGFSQAELEGRAFSGEPFIPRKPNSEKTTMLSSSLQDIYQRIWLGSFPRLHVNQHADRDIFYRSYVQTYLQRDVKDVISVSSELTFHKFLSAIAARTGQLLNYADLARDVGVDNKTVKAWLSVLEASGIIYLLYPYHNNLSKRLIKTPKIYFLDTGLCSYLTKWTTPESLEAGAMSGALLETYLFSEILKSYWHNGKDAHFHYYRDFDQSEIDLVIEEGDTLYPVEFKKTATPSKSSFKHFHLLKKLEKKVGMGAIICFAKRSLPLSENVIALPAGHI